MALQQPSNSGNNVVADVYTDALSGWECPSWSESPPALHSLPHLFRTRFAC